MRVISLVTEGSRSPEDQTFLSPLQKTQDGGANVSQRGQRTAWQLICHHLWAVQTVQALRWRLQCQGRNERWSGEQLIEGRQEMLCLWSVRSLFQRMPFQKV